MSNDLEKSLRKAMNRKYETPTLEATEAMTKKHRPPAVETNEATDDNEILSIGESSAESKAKMDIGDEQEADKRKKRDRPLKLFGWLCMAVFVVSLMLSPVSSVDTSEAAQNALVEKVSTSLPAGTGCFPAIRISVGKTIPLSIITNKRTPGFGSGIMRRRTGIMFRFW